MASNLLVIVIISAVAILLVLGGMAIGVMFGRKPLSGSCGGIANSKDEHGNIRCGICTNPAEACKELQERAQSDREAVG